ncbi:uncharacterized protein LOC116169364 [Photinus pyralis]|uniref:uncharacterized protein LOC116169364 n=1 Tax=Photinus pyralis TaxID=7054 RepID=UPI0012673C31|nr:uncharacterized protein LOC116169364 [Photinus pyralis]
MLLTLAFGYCLLSTTFAAPPEQQVMLEDMERQNVGEDHRERYEYTYQQQIRPKLPQRVEKPQNMRMEYGFRPMKTAVAHVPNNQYYEQQSQSLLTYQPSGLAQSPPAYFIYQPVQQREQQANVQPITDNYLTQYVYLQQPSNNIDTAYDPRTNLQYFMYIQPEYLQSGASTLQPQLSSSYLYQGDKLQYQLVSPSAVQPQVTYIPKTLPTPQKFSSSSLVHGPKSLLDSYVPSHLQVKYINQLQRVPKRKFQSHGLSKNLRPEQNM